MFYCTDLVDSVVQCLCHRLLGCFLGQAFVAVLGSVGNLNTEKRGRLEVGISESLKTTNYSIEHSAFNNVCTRVCNYACF